MHLQVLLPFLLTFAFVITLFLFTLRECDKAQKEGSAGPDTYNTAFRRRLGYLVGSLLLTIAMTWTLLALSEPDVPFLSTAGFAYIVSVLLFIGMSFWARASAEAQLARFGPAAYRTR